LAYDEVDSIKSKELVDLTQGIFTQEVEIAYVANVGFYHWPSHEYFLHTRRFGVKIAYLMYKRGEILGEKEAKIYSMQCWLEVHK
jgi:hypothetical protein